MEHDYLRRLDSSFYQGNAVVHWSHSIKDRRCGWLNESFHRNFRDFLFSISREFKIETLAYVLMPDHFHLLWRGMSDSSDQKRGSAWLRRRLNLLLKKKGFELQKQAYDHVLRPKERDRFALEKVAHYILANPERAGLGDDWPFRGSVVGGRPDVSWAGEMPEDFWVNL